MGLLGDFTGWIDSRKRVAAKTLGELMADPAQALEWLAAQERDRRREDVARTIENVQGQRAALPESREYYKQQATEAAAENLGTYSDLLPMQGGLLGTFAGVNAKTANKGMLKAAQEMTAKGAAPEEVWKATGWTDQFPDGKWRFEIPDNKAYLPWNKNEGIGNFLENVRVDSPARMGRVIQHQELGAAYPEMMSEMRISDMPSEAIGAGTKGAFLAPNNIHLNSGLSVDDALSPLLHESQHAVQQREGFARGGSPEMEGLKKLYAGKLLDLAPKKYAEAQAAWDAAIKAEMGKGIGQVDAAIAAKKKNPEIWNDLKKWDRWAQAKELNDASLVVGNYLSPDFKFDAYKSLAGEAEARLTQSRMNLTPEQRAARPPWLEFDVPREQQIVHGRLGENAGPAMAISPVYHGSPHKFDKFDLSKIGTGEGAQAYGHGLYFAETPETATTYKFAGKPSYANNRVAEVAYRSLEASGGKKEEALKWLHKRYTEAPKEYKQMYADAMNNFDTFIKEGNLYESSLRWPDPAREAADPLGPQHFLDWDKPLSEQPEAVREFVKPPKDIEKLKKQYDRTLEKMQGLPTLSEQFGKLHNKLTQISREMDYANNLQSVTGADIYNRAASGMIRQDIASQRMLDAGIPGIRYLDAGSRSAGDGTYNYVVFDDALIEMLKRNGEPVPKRGLLSNPDEWR